MHKNSRQYMPTYFLITANVAVYAFTSILSGSLTTSDNVLSALGQINANVWNGEVWRLFTAIFVHADIVHIVGNMFFLLIFGLRAEDMFDIKEYLSIYFLSGLFGGLLTLILWGPETLSIGASGAIFGILGATIIYARRSIGQSIIGGLMYAFFFFIINLGTNVNYLAHLGGLATGLLIGYALAASRRNKQVTYEYKYPDSWGKAGYAVETDTCRICGYRHRGEKRSSGKRQHFDFHFLSVFQFEAFPKWGGSDYL